MYVASATFVKYFAAQLNSSRNPFNTMNAGACSVVALSGISAIPQTYAESFPEDPIVPLALDAGTSIVVKGAGAAVSLFKGRDSYHPIGSAPYYSGNLFFGTLPGYLEPGTVTISGTGGKDIGAVRATVDVPAILKWTNMDSVLTVDRAAGQLVTWTGGDPAGTVKISGTSLTSLGGVNSAGATFTCTAKTSDGQFMISPAILLSPSREFVKRKYSWLSVWSAASWEQYPTEELYCEGRGFCHYICEPRCRASG